MFIRHFQFTLKNLNLCLILPDFCILCVLEKNKHHVFCNILSTRETKKTGRIEAPSHFI